MESGPNGSAWSRICEGAGLSRSNLNLISGLLEDIVVQAVPFGRVGATHLTASESRQRRAPGASWRSRPIAEQLPALDDAGDPARERDRSVRSLPEFMVNEAGRQGRSTPQTRSEPERDHGATIAELIAATGWLAHTTRPRCASAALQWRSIRRTKQRELFLRALLRMQTALANDRRAIHRRDGWRASDDLKT